MFDFFARHRLPSASEVRRVRFTTVNPGVSARAHWVAVEQQVHSLEPSRVDVQWDPGKVRVVGTTHNVRRLVFNAEVLGAPGNAAAAGVEIELDGQKLGLVGRSVADAVSADWGWAQPIRMQRSEDGVWSRAEPLSVREKGPRRGGGFKEAFRHRMIFVYATRGTREENDWSLARARFDAESFWYRGNGSVDVMADAAFDPAAHRDRGVIVYGHADMNAAWGALLEASPVQVRRGGVQVGARQLQGNDLACLFLQPRPDSEVASVGVVAGTGMVGLRVTERLPYFMAGTGYPDCLVLTPTAWERGGSGVSAAGFFGPDWSVERGDWTWQDPQ